MGKPPLLELSADEAVRRVALSYLDCATQALSRLHDDEDLESLHALRVSLRKLRSCLRAYDHVLGATFSKKVRGRLKKLASSTNPGRDAEVQLEWVRELGAFEEGGFDDPSLRPGVGWIESRLATRRAEAYAQVREHLEESFLKIGSKLRNGLETYTVEYTVGEPSPLRPFREVAAEVLEGQLDALVGDLSDVHSIEDEQRAHEARIHGKRLRYQLEPLRGELEAARAHVKELKALQDLLGDLNDLHNLTATLGQALEDNAVETARRLREAAAQGYDNIAKELEHDERPGLLALLSKVQSDRRRLFDSLLEEWLGEGGRLGALERAVRETTRDLREGTPVEIERKYLLRELPPHVFAHAPLELEQGYLPGEDLIERVRKTRTGNGASYIRTVKLGRGVRRIEVEEACEPRVFDTLWSLTVGRRVVKRRYAIPEGERVWEIDQFTDRDLVLAEIELEASDEAVAFPEWLEPYVDREVTDDPEYVNANLAR